MIVRSKKYVSTNFAFLEHFTWLYEINFEMSLWFTTKNALWSISHDCAKISHDHAKWKYIIFQLIFDISSISFFWIHLNHLQIISKAWSKCIASSSSSTSFALFNSISLLSLNASKITLKYFQNFTKTSSISCKGNNVLLEHIRHNYYSKGMELMRIII